MAAEIPDLSNCDREPIHIPGSIQAHGCLIACDGAATTILRHSANAGTMLGYPGELIGADLVDVLGRGALHDLRNAITTAPEGGHAASVLGLALASGQRFDITVHRLAGGVIAEFEPAGGGPDPAPAGPGADRAGSARSTMSTSWSRAPPGSPTGFSATTA